MATEALAAAFADMRARQSAAREEVDALAQTVRGTGVRPPRPSMPPLLAQKEAVAQCKSRRTAAATITTTSANVADPEELVRSTAAPDELSRSTSSTGQCTG